MEQSHMHKLLLLISIFLLKNCFVFAQNNATYQAKIGTIAQSGFYNISLSPQVIAKCKSELEDIRIKDNGDKEIPYILYTESAQPDEEAFTEFPLSYSEDRTAIYINNILPNSLDKLFLLIKNSEAQRIATLSGSDDETQWFVIKENIILQNEFTADSDDFVQSVSFPKSSYKYFRIMMPGKNVLPLNIVKAGVYRHNFTSNVYDSLPQPAIIQKDSSDKKSYIWLSFDDNYQVDKLSLYFSGSKFYKRYVVLYDKNTINPALAEDTVFSVNQSGIDLHAKTNRLLLVIDNKDNLPLTVNHVIAFQLHTSVTAYLEMDKNYALYFGDSTAIAPSYDLQYFSDSIGSNILPLSVKTIKKIATAPVVKKEESNIGKWLLWGIIIAVLLALIYFSFRMIRDISNKKDNDVHL